MLVELQDEIGDAIPSPRNLSNVRAHGELKPDRYSRLHVLTILKTSKWGVERVVDEETRKDLDIVREVLKVTKEVTIERAYDFSFAKKADSKLTQAGRKP